MFKFVDGKKSLVDAVRELGIEAVHSDYFIEGERTPHSVLMTASNPSWTMGGGIDAKFADYFPDEVRTKQLKGGGMERIGDICFCITVGHSLQATKEQVEEAIRFALSETKDDETLLIHGAGTGIGRLPVEEFLDIMKAIRSET